MRWGGPLRISSGLSNMAASPLELFQWLGSSWLSNAIRESRWAFATIEVFHLLGLALLGGSALTLGGRILGLVVARQPVSVVARETTPVALTGLLVLLVSGTLLVADGPLRYYANVAFRAKMLLVIAAVSASVWIHRYARRIVPADRPSASLRAAALFTLLTWFGVALAGRLIGVL